MSSVVLDASALIALLKEEPGADKVAEVVRSALLGAVNLAEVVSHFIHAGMPASGVDAMLRPLPIEVVPVDADLAREAGYLRTATAKAGLSLGDRFCLALAKRENLAAWTTDRQWREIAGASGVEIVIIR